MQAKFFKMMLVSLGSLIYASSANSSPSVDDRITTYANEAKSQIDLGNLGEACHLYKLANGLAKFKSTNAPLQSAIENESKATCDKSERVYAERLRTHQKNMEIENRKFCNWIEPIFKGCAGSYDIDACVRIRSNGVQLREINNRCNF